MANYFDHVQMIGFFKNDTDFVDLPTLKEKWPIRTKITSRHNFVTKGTF
jgi:hypothetical protein